MLLRASWVGFHGFAVGFVEAPDDSLCWGLAFCPESFSARFDDGAADRAPEPVVFGPVGIASLASERERLLGAKSLPVVGVQEAYFLLVGVG